MVAFGPLFDQVFADFQRKHEMQTKMKPKVDGRSKEWNFAIKSGNRSKQLEDALSQEDEVVAALDAKILNRKKEIESLQFKM